MSDDADTILQGYLGTPVPEPKGMPSPTSADDILTHYTGEKTPGGVPVDAVTGRPRVIINRPEPPIEGLTQEQNEAVSATAIQGGENPKRYSSPTRLIPDLLSSASEVPGDILNDTATNARVGIDTFKSAGEDLAANRPASAVGKAAAGTVQYLASPVSAIMNNIINKPVANMTGSKAIGNAAEDVASLALPVAKIPPAIKASIPTNQAFKSFVDAIGGTDKIPQFLKDYTSNPRLAAMDVSPSLLQTTQKLAVTPGDHQNLLSGRVNDRIASASGAVKGAYDATMGTPVDVLQKLNDMKKAAKEVGQKQIQPVLEKTNPVNVTPVIEHIDNILKPGVNSVVSSGTDLATTRVKQVLADVRRYLTDNKSNRTDPQDLHTIQSSLGNTAYKLSKSANGEDRLVASALANVKEKIVDAIDTASPQVNGAGTYRPARASFADEKDIEEGFDKGRHIFDKGSSNENLPEFWDNWVKKANPSVVEAAKEGARTAVRGQIEGMRNAVGQKGTEIPQVEFSKQKLSSLFGKNEIDQMSKNLNDERKIADTNKKLYQDSQTAMRLKADSRVSQHTDTGLEQNSLLPYLAEGVGAYTTGLPGIGASVYTAANMAKKHIINPRINARADARNFELSRLASATGAEKQDIVNNLAKLIAPTPKPSLLTRASNVAGKLIGP